MFIYLLLILVTSQRTPRKTLGSFISTGLLIPFILDTLTYSHIKVTASSSKHFRKLGRFSSNLIITLSIIRYD